MEYKNAKKLEAKEFYRLQQIEIGFIVLKNKYVKRKEKLEHILVDSIPGMEEEQEYNSTLRFIEELEEILKDE